MEAKVTSPEDEDTLSEGPELAADSLTVDDWGAATTIGLIRAENEDHYGVKEPLFVVADGMGGVAGGATASKLTVEYVLAADPTNGWVSALSTINQRVRTECNEAGFPTAGSTLVGVLVEQHRCVTLSIGDSRICRYRDGQLQQLTTDHNLRTLRSEEGLDPNLTDERGKPRALTSFVGNLDSSQRVDVGTVSAQPGDRLVLTSDGVHEQVDIAEMATLLGLPTCQESAYALIHAADSAGGRDNATAIVLSLGASTNEGNTDDG